ncbi:MAG: F0F1 ATP synthase subunit A [Gammaproteobacteria bacterium]
MEKHAGSWVNVLVNLEPEWLQPYLPLEVVTAWLILGLVVFVAWLGTRRMQRVPASGWQTLGEWGYNLCTSLCGQFGLAGERYAPMLGTLFAYILIMNLTGLIPGFTSPTATLNMTLALALVTLASVQIYGMREKGWRYLEHFVDGPWWMWPLMAPIHLIGEIARILSLSIRLFGNIFAKETVIGQVLVLLGSIVVMHQLNILLRAPMVLGGVLLLHIPLLLLGLLISLIQAVIFVMLTAVYLQGAVSSHS